MVLVAILGVVDLLGAVSLGLLVLGFPLPHLQAVAALMLLLKSLVFIGDVISVIDVAVSITMFALLWVSAPTLALGLAIYLGIKGAISLF